MKIKGAKHNLPHKINISTYMGIVTNYFYVKLIDAK